MPLPINPGPIPEICAEMAYLPRSNMSFPTDFQHDFRDHLYAVRTATLADWAGEAERVYLRAADILRRRRIDPLAIALDMDTIFDARTLMVAHDHMAAYWRTDQMHEVMASGGKKYWGIEPNHLYSQVNSLNELTAIFRLWLRWVVNAWADHRPDILELFLLTVVGEHTRTGQSVEAELFYTLATIYPVPGVIVPKPLPVPFAP